MYCLAIDIGASSGRHILASLENGKMLLQEVYRFDNGLEKKNGHLIWNTEKLFNNVIEGIKKCKELGKIPDTIGIDTWGVDYALLDANGKLIEDIIAYRDDRTFTMMNEVEKIIPYLEYYKTEGLQRVNYNTIYQLFDDKLSGKLQKAEHFLMVPEYLNYLLTGVIKNEYTNASTTGLLDAEKRDWDYNLIKKLGYPEKLFKKLYQPTETVGFFSEEIVKKVGFSAKVVLPATHDTASAVMAVPSNENPLFLSSGTWSLLGVELNEPITNKQACEFNMTNEGGYGRTIRFLKNIMGLWMIQNIKREYSGKYNYEDLMNAAINEKNIKSVIDVNDISFLAPESMINAVKKYCKNTLQQVPETVGEIMNVVYRSLALFYAKTIGELEIITGKTYDTIHIVGGGSKDRYLSELTKLFSGKKVISGPTEGTAIGNITAQFIAAKQISSVKEGREIIKNSFDIREIN